MPTKTRPSIVALVPMRHHSERVPGKNYRPLGGRPLYAYILESLLRCPEIAAILVDTDSPEIAGGLARNFPSVQCLDRPEHLRGGMVSMNEVLLHDVEQVPADFYLQTHSTNPLLRPETISRSIQAFLSRYPEKDALFSVTRFQTRFWDPQVRPVNHDPSVLIRTQDLEPLYLENSCIYIFERESFLASKNRLGERPQMFEIEPLEAVDIDEEADFKLVESLVLLRGGAEAR